MSKIDWFTCVKHGTLPCTVNSLPDQLLYNLNLIELCSACAKLDTTVQIASNALFGLVWQRPS